MNKSNFKTAMMLTSALAMTASVLFTACGNDEPSVGSQVDEQGLTQGIHDMIPDDILNKMVDIGMPIIGGGNPPDVTGTFLGAPWKLKASTQSSDVAGAWYYDVYVTFSDQDNQKLTVKVNIITNGTDSKSEEAYIVGKDSSFTVFAKLDNVERDLHYKTAKIYSGTISKLGGIKNLYSSSVMLDNMGDPYNDLMDNGTVRLIYDSDGFSEKVELDN